MLSLSTALLNGPCLNLIAYRAFGKQSKITGRSGERKRAPEIQWQIQKSRSSRRGRVSVFRGVHADSVKAHLEKTARHRLASFPAAVGLEIMPPVQPARSLISSWKPLNAISRQLLKSYV